MQELLARIGFGCGRLRGGFEESSSRRLLDEALHCGIRYFDTAPYYGASEKILGRGLRGLRSQVQVCTKAGLYGSAPNLAANLRGLILTTVRAILPDATINRLKQRRRAQEGKVIKQRGYGNFDPILIRRSVEKSLEALETEFLDCLMLHEPSMADPTQEVVQLLVDLVREGRAVKLGVGTFSHLDDLPPFGDVAQFAIDRAVRNVGKARIYIGHGLFRGLNSEVFEHCVREAGILQTLPALKRYVSEPLGTSALLLNTVLFGTNIDRVLVSTASPQRLREFMATAANIFEDIQANYAWEIDRQFRHSLHQYFARKAVRGDSDD